MIEEDLESAVEQRGVRDVSLVAARRPQPLVHLDVEQIVGRRALPQDALDGAETGAVLEGLAQARVDALVEVAFAHEVVGLEAGRVDVREARRRVHRVVAGYEAQGSARVQFAAGIRFIRSGRDGEGELVRRVGHRKQLRLEPHRRLGDGTRLQELERLHMQGNALERLQEQLDVAGRRHDRGVVHAVLRQPGEIRLGKPRFEQRVLARHPVADQRAVGVFPQLEEHLVVAHVVGRRLVVARIPGQQVADRLGTGILRGEVQVDTRPEQRSEGLVEAAARIGVTHQRRNADRTPGIAFETLRDRGLQGAVRRDFQDDVGPVVPHDGLHRLRESHRPADVRPPVGGVQRLRRDPGHRGHHGYVGVERAFVQEAQRREGVLPDRIHGAGVERDVPGNQPMLHVAPVQSFHDGAHGGFPAADDGTGGGVLASDLDAQSGVRCGLPAHSQRLEQRLDARPVQADRQHAAGAGRALLEGGAMEHQARCLRQGERSAGIGGRHLAGAVSDHALGIDAPGLEQLHERALEHEDDGLGELDFVERFLRGGETGLAQRTGRVLPPMVLDDIDDPPEDGIGVVQRAPATGPLRALSGKHHGDPALFGIGRGDGGWIPLETPQRFDQIVPGADGERGPGGEMGAAAAEIAGEGVQVHLPALERLAQRSGALFQSAGRPRRQWDHETGLARERHRPDPPGLGTIFADHAVPVGAAEAKGVDADQHRAVRERIAGRLHQHRATVEVDVRIRDHVVLRHRREGPPPHHQHDLVEGRRERGRFHVPHVALDACHPERRVPPVTERFGDGVALDAVADHRAGRMGFDVVELPRLPAGAGAGRAHQVHLRMSGRRRDVAPRRKARSTVGGAGGIDRGGLHHGVDGVAVPFGRRQRFDRENEGSFRTHVTVRLRVEGVASPIRADDPQRVEAGAEARGAEVVGRRHESLFAVAGAQCVQRGMQRRQAGGTCGAAGERGSHQVEVIGDAVGQHGHADAGDGKLGCAQRPAPVRGCRNLCSDEDAGSAVPQRQQVPSGLFTGLPGTGQQHPYVRIGRQHFVVRHAEETAIEELLPLVADQAFVGAREAARPRELSDRPVAPPVAAGDGLPDGFPFAQESPEIVVGTEAARQAVGISDDGDGIVGPGIIHRAL